ncbi:MAG: right-handed parallel beta-helix repeat-containing protein [Paracoccaceae bacterium]
MGRMLALGLLCAAALFPAAARPELMDYRARLDMKAELALLGDLLPTSTLTAHASAVMAGVGLNWGPPVLPDDSADDFVPTDGAVLEVVDIRLLLTQIAIQTGARNHVALVRAQGARNHNVILLRGGLVRLADLALLAKGTPAAEFLKMDAGRLVLTRPLAIWSDAGLSLGANDHLMLDRPSGSFLANLGRLDVAGGKISGSSGQNTAEPAFRPFVITAGQGSFAARDASFESLGFAAATVFGGLSVANNGLVPARRASVVRGSTFLDVGTLGLIGTTGAVVVGNRISASGDAALLISGSKNATVAANRLSSLAGKQAIRVTAGSAMVRLDGNLVSGGARTGLLIDRGSRDVLVTRNLVVGSQTTGISVEAVTCVLMIGNLVASNGGAGISIGNTDAVEVRGNAVLFNRGSGVMVRDQAATALVRVSGNVFIANRDGLRGATAGNLVLSANRLDGQIPRIFAGDLSRLSADWLRNRNASVPVAIGTGQMSQAAPCAIAGEG